MFIFKSFSISWKQSKKNSQRWIDTLKERTAFILGIMFLQLYKGP